MKAVLGKFSADRESTVLPDRMFEMFDKVKIYQTFSTGGMYPKLKRGEPMDRVGVVIGYCITKLGWEYFVAIDWVEDRLSGKYNSWVQEIGLDKIPFIKEES